MLLCLASAGMAMIGPTYAGGLCALMLPCLAIAGMAMVGPTHTVGLCSAMLLCLASAGMAKRVSPMKVGWSIDAAMPC